MATAHKPRGKRKKSDFIAEIPSETKDRESTLPDYEIMTYPTDFTLEILAKKWRKKAITVPGFQRKYVWSQAQASKLIESFLLGLPVPPIFLYEDRDENSLGVIDGQQRLRSIVDFFDGYFGEEIKGSRPVFRLIGLHDQSKFLDKTFDDLDEQVSQRLRDTVLRSIVIKQLRPDDNSSIFHIFERLNTGGTSLVGQEIRNCIYHGKFNNLLRSLNRNSQWREIIGKTASDRRQRDIEMILRFFALFHSAKTYKKPMKKFLSDFMAANRNPEHKAIKQFREEFETTVKRVRESLGPKPFHIHAGMNVAVFDAVFTAFASHPTSKRRDIAKRFSALIKNSEFLEYVTAATTDEAVVSSRLKLANAKLFG